MADWSEMKDGDGKTYYVNMTTRQSTWARPEGFKSKGAPMTRTASSAMSTGAAAEVATTIQDIEAKLQAASKETKELKERLASMQKEVKDISASVVSGQNEVKQLKEQATKLNASLSAARRPSSLPVPNVLLKRPSTQIANSPFGRPASPQPARPSSPMPLASTMNAEPLPPGWKEVQDPTSGQTYYYDTQTRQSTWRRPVMLMATPSSPLFPPPPPPSANFPALSL